VLVGPRSYIAPDEDAAEESLRNIFKDVLEEFNKPPEEKIDAVRSNSTIPTEDTETIVGSSTS
jgi:hypothetical protein